jgi:hypothetical protein
MTLTIAQTFAIVSIVALVSMMSGIYLAEHPQVPTTQNCTANLTKPTQIIMFYDNTTIANAYKCPTCPDVRYIKNFAEKDKYFSCWFVGEEIFCEFYRDNQSYYYQNKTWEMVK